VVCCALFNACSLYKGGPPPSSSSSRVTLEGKEFEEADTNNDQVIDKEEVAAYLEKKDAKRKEDNKSRAFWVWLGILGLSLGLCACTPVPAAYIKKRFIGIKNYFKEVFLKRWERLRKKSKNDS